MSRNRHADPAGVGHNSDGEGVRRGLAACAGFLLATLSADLRVDRAVLGAPPGPLPADVLDPVAAYYRTITSDVLAWGPIGAVMVVTVIGSAWDAWRRGGTRRWLAMILCAAPIALALIEVIPEAVALGAGADSPGTQSARARTIAWLHIGDLTAMITFLVLQLRGDRKTRRPKSPRDIERR